MDSKFNSFNQKKAETIKILDDCCKLINNDKLCSLIMDKKEKLSSDRFVVSVFGHFSNGKSTFLNSLMGFDHEVLKEDDLASTATITRLKYASKNDANFEKVDVVYRDGSTKQIEMNELSNFIARNHMIDVEKTISEVVLYVDSQFLKNGVEIVDTPGFNSTYEIHSEIAMQQVEKSDAAIFLFSCEKPGNSEELDFLKKVKRYMNRVFFVLNKFDLSNDEGLTEKESIYNKMQSSGINSEGKIIYPLSSIRAREAISENNEEKLNASGLPIFVDALTEYLTSTDFVKDRLLSPLNSALISIEKEKESVSIQMEACRKDKADLNAEIQMRKKEIRIREAELRDKKRGINSKVKEELRETKSEVKHIANKISSAQSERLAKINSQFEIRLANFEEMDFESYILFSNEWENAAEHLEDQILGILDTAVDTENEFNKISGTIIGAIRSHLKLEKIDVDKPIFDFSELEEIDKEIEKAKLKYDETYKMVTNLYASKEEKEDVLVKIEKTEKDFERLKTKKENKIDALSNCQVEYGYYEETEYFKTVRRGPIGRLFFGETKEKRLKVPQKKRVEYVNDRAKKDADKEISEIEKELSEKRLCKDTEIKKLKESIDKEEFKQIERQLAKAELEQDDDYQDYTEKRQSQKEEKRKRESAIISVKKDEYLNGIKNRLNGMCKIITDFLDKSQGNFVSIICTCLDAEDEDIIREKNNIEKMVSMNNLSPKEIEEAILKLSQDSVNLSECMVAIEKVEEKVKI